MNSMQFFIFIITIEFWTLNSANSCPTTHCSCDSINLWNCKITQNVDQIDCYQGINSNTVTVNLELRYLNIDRKHELFINTNNCKIKILKISTNLIPSNQLIRNIDSLNYLIIEGSRDSETQFESNINNFLFGFNQLYRLKIENINLHYWSSQNLETCNSIEELEFKNLKIESIDFDSFINCKKLTKLTIRFNKVLKMYSSSFKGLNRLLYLILSSNQCEEIITNENGWWDQQSLIKLDFSNNKLTKLKIRTFIGLSKLEQLNLNSNLIVFIDNSAFEGLNNLKVLNLKNNPNLKIIDLNYFNSMKSSLNNLIIDKNYLDCFDNKMKLKQFSILIQKTFQELNDCKYHKLITSISTTSTIKLKEPITPTLMITVAVLVTLLIVFIFVGGFIYCHSRKKIRKYRNSGSDKLTSHSCSSKHLDINQGSSHTFENLKPYSYINNTINGLVKYKSSPVLSISSL